MAEAAPLAQSSSTRKRLKSVPSTCERNHAGVILAQLLFAGQHGRTFAFALGTFQFFEVIEDLRFDLVFDFVGELEAVGAEDLDAVVGPGIVRGRDHDAGGEAVGAGEVGDAGRGDDAGAGDLRACAVQTTGEGAADPVAGFAGVLPDENRGANVFSRRDANRGRVRWRRRYARRADILRRHREFRQCRKAVVLGWHVVSEDNGVTSLLAWF